MRPEEVGFSPSRLARLDDVMKRRYVDSGHLPGVLTMIYRAASWFIPACRDRWTWNGQAHARGHDLPHLFHEQADHGGRIDDAGRGRTDRPRG